METVPGGVYVGTDGTYHDANGKPVDADGKPVKQPVTANLPEPVEEPKKPAAKGK